MEIVSDTSATKMAVRASPGDLETLSGMVAISMIGSIARRRSV